jgi:hypothetical protein
MVQCIPMVPGGVYALRVELLINEASREGRATTTDDRRTCDLALFPFFFSCFLPKCLL